MTQEEWVAEVRSWVGTKFRWQGRIKANKDAGELGGVDCWGLIIASAHNCGYIPSAWDVRSYSRRTDLVGLSFEHLPQWFEALPRDSELQAGDIVTIFHEDTRSGPMHMGVLYDHTDGCLGIVHSEDYRQIVEHGAELFLHQVTQSWRPWYH